MEEKEYRIARNGRGFVAPYQVRCSFFFRMVKRLTKKRMARPRKQTVDFFQHDCNHGKTMFTLEQKFQCKGYCLWFKLLEELGKANGHCLDFNDVCFEEFFSAKTMVSVTEMYEIMDLLSRLGAIDKKLWLKRIVWSQNFVDNLGQVYDKRIVSVPEKPVSVTEIGVSGDGNTQSKVKESKVNISGAIAPHEKLEKSLFKSSKFPK